eukprot:1068219-Prymnesium_polylepis.1
MGAAPCTAASAPIWRGSTCVGGRGSSRGHSRRRRAVRACAGPAATRAVMMGTGKVMMGTGKGMMGT